MGVRIRFPDEIFQTGDQGLQGEETVGKAEGNKVGFSASATEAPKMFRKGLPGRKEVGKRRMATAEAIGGRRAMACTKS